MKNAVRYYRLAYLGFFALSGAAFSANWFQNKWCDNSLQNVIRCTWVKPFEDAKAWVMPDKS